MKVVSDIMVKDPFSVKDTDNVHDARMVLKDKGIRHLPVVNEQGEFIGLLTQRSLLNNAFNLVEKFGLNRLDSKEQQIKVADVMTRDCETISPATDLVTAGEFFSSKKASCLPVVEGKALKGIVTSVDFLKLSLYLLNQSES